MKRTICMLLGLSLVSVTAMAGDKKSGELTDPTEILRKADAAAKAVKVVKYDVVFEGLGNAQARFPKVEASIIMSGFASGAPEKIAIEAKYNQPGSTETRRVTSGSDGDMYFVVDHQAKKAYEDIDPQVVGSVGRIVAMAMVLELGHEHPFTDEINGKVKELKGSKSINGEDCYEVYIVYATPQEQAVTWYVSKKDFLPRGRIDLRPGPDGLVPTRQKMIANLVTDPKLDKDTFKLKLPKGYSKTDDFAP